MRLLSESEDDMRTSVYVILENTEVGYDGAYGCDSITTTDILEGKCYKTFDDAWNYLLAKVIKEGGFGYTYRGFDTFFKDERDLYESVSISNVNELMAFMAESRGKGRRLWIDVDFEKHTIDKNSRDPITYTIQELAVDTTTVSVL